MVIDDKGIIVLSASQSDSVSHSSYYCHRCSFDFTCYRVQRSSQNDMPSRNFGPLIYPIRIAKNSRTVCFFNTLSPQKHLD